MLSRRNFIKLFSAAFTPLDAVASVAPSATPVDLNDPVSSYIKLALSFFADKFCSPVKIMDCALSSGSIVSAEVAGSNPGDRRRTSLFAEMHMVRGFATTKFWDKQVEDFLTKHESSIDAKWVQTLKGFSRGGFAWVNEAANLAKSFCDQKNINFPDAVKQRLQNYGESLVVTPPEKLAISSDVNKLSKSKREMSRLLHDVITTNPPVLTERLKAELEAVFTKDAVVDALTSYNIDLIESIDGKTERIINKLADSIEEKVMAFIRVQYSSIDAMRKMQEEGANLDEETKKALLSGDITELFGDVCSTPNRIDSARKKLMLNANQISAADLFVILSSVFSEEIAQGKVYISPPNEDSKRLFVEVAADSDAYLLLSTKTNQIETNRSYF